VLLVVGFGLWLGLDLMSGW